jgi:hypothetical protein
MPLRNTKKPPHRHSFYVVGLGASAGGMSIKPNAIYLIPPNHNMTLNDQHFCLTTQKKHPRINYPIDLLFESLALNYKEPTDALNRLKPLLFKPLDETDSTYGYCAPSFESDPHQVFVQISNFLADFITLIASHINDQSLINPASRMS